MWKRGKLIMMFGGYPNLELLEYKSKNILQQIDNEKYKNLDLRADVFLQTWGSTALGFGGVGGQAMSDAYTTVFGDILKDAYVVFFGKQIAYVIENPTEQFFEDLNRRQMVSVNKARQRY